MTIPNSYTTRDAARILDLSMSTVQRMADEGLLQSFRTPGGYRRIDAGAVEQYRRTRISATVTVLESLGDDAS